MKYAIFKYLWLIAVLPKTAQLPILCVVLCGMYLKEGLPASLKYDLRSDRYFTLVMACNAVYAFSIIANAAGGQYELSRILAACNTFAITCVGFGFYHLYTKAEVDMEKIQKYMFVNLNIMLGLLVLYYLIGDKGNLPILGKLSRWDKVRGEYTTRFLGYLEYSNLTVFMYLYCYLFSVGFLNKHLHPLAAIPLEVLYLMPMAAANSRTGVLCGAAMTCVSVVLTKHDGITRFYLKHKAKIWSICLLLAAAAVVLLHEPLLGALESILSYRAGSTRTRSMIYMGSLEKMLTESPIWGCGIKAIIPDSEYPYGSHSTYLGMYYKAGLLGGTIYLAATAMKILELIRRKERSCFDILVTFTFLALFALAVLEDLDGANWSYVMFMSLLALCTVNKDAIQQNAV